jgi:hypothetical protein
VAVRDDSPLIVCVYDASVRAGFVLLLLIAVDLFDVVGLIGTI